MSVLLLRQEQVAGGGQLEVFGTLPTALINLRLLWGLSVLQLAKPVFLRWGVGIGSRGMASQLTVRARQPPSLQAGE